MQILNKKKGKRDSRGPNTVTEMKNDFGDSIVDWTWLKKNL